MKRALILVVMVAGTAALIFGCERSAQKGELATTTNSRNGSVSAAEVASTSWRAG